VLGMPPAFNLSQDQTLQFNTYSKQKNKKNKKNKKTLRKALSLRSREAPGSLQTLARKPPLQPTFQFCKEQKS
jgi:hypothetical protein